LEKSKAIPNNSIVGFAVSKTQKLISGADRTNSQWLFETA